MKRSAFFAPAIAALIACAPVIETRMIPISAKQLTEIKSATAYRLKDPSAAQFRNIRRIESIREDGTSTTVVCGEVNGKNAFGGYVGFHTFKGQFAGDKFKLHGIGDSENNWLYEAMCPG